MRRRRQKTAITGNHYTQDPWMVSTFRLIAGTDGVVKAQAGPAKAHSHRKRPGTIEVSDRPSPLGCTLRLFTERGSVLIFVSATDEAIRKLTEP